MLLVVYLTHYACVFLFPRFSWSISVLGLCAVGAIIGGLALAGIVPGAASTAGITVDPTAPVDPNEYQSCMQHIIYHVQLGFGVHEVYFLGRVFPSTCSDFFPGDYAPDAVNPNPLTSTCSAKAALVCTANGVAGVCNSYADSCCPGTAVVHQRHNMSAIYSTMQCFWCGLFLSLRGDIFHIIWKCYLYRRRFFDWFML